MREITLRLILQNAINLWIKMLKMLHGNDLCYLTTDEFCVLMTTGMSSFQKTPARRAPQVYFLVLKVPLPLTVRSHLKRDKFITALYFLALKSVQHIVERISQY